MIIMKRIREMKTHTYSYYYKLTYYLTVNVNSIYLIVNDMVRKTNPP